ncbi:hypothetical protein, partial [Klebsiella pneumoniae]|uniref:hypothetical protein n=1 Tax=Klebsiella pneumoniae TaxID=573 RepID=UPI002263F383
LIISEAARTRLFKDDVPIEVERTSAQMPDYIQQVLEVDVRPGETVRVEKMVAFWTSRDPAVGDTLEKASRSTARYLDFGPAWERHAAAWQGLWDACDLRVRGDDEVQQLLRLHTSHLLQ